MNIFSTILFLSDVDDDLTWYLEKNLSEKTKQTWMIKNKRFMGGKEFYNEIKTSPECSLVMFNPHILFFLNNWELAKIKLESLSNILKSFNKRSIIVLSGISKDVIAEFSPLMSSIFDEVIDASEFTIKDADSLSKIITQKIVYFHSQGDKWSSLNE